MSIKRRLISSHLLMAVIPLIAVIVIGGIGFWAAKKILYEDISGVTTMSEEFSDIQAEVDSYMSDSFLTDSGKQEELMASMKSKGFKTCVWINDEVSFTNMNEREQSFLMKLRSESEAEEEQGAHRLWISNMDIRMVEDYFQVDSTSVQISVASIGEMALMQSIDPEIYVTTAVVVIITLCAITAIIIWTCLHLSSRMTLDIVNSLDNLSDAADRIKNGNYSENVKPGNDAELEKVCDSFNDMQHQLKTNIEKNLRYEKDRREMMAGISHDLRTPLTSIKSYIRGLQDGVAKSEEKQKEYLSVAYRKSCDMEGLIEQLFLMSKLETGSQPFHFRPVAVQNFMATVLDSLETDVLRQNGTIDFQSTCTQEKVMMDSGQMHRVITNLIQNSIKYGHDDEGKLQIGIWLYPWKNQIVIRMRDHGKGVPETQLERIFDTFYRGDEARSNPERGSGLGLSISKQIVEAHKGQIHAENDHGLMFVIELPCIQDLDDSDSNRTE